MKVVNTEKAFALVFETAQDVLNMQVELEAMARKLDEGIENLPLSFAVMDEGANDSDREALVQEILRVKGDDPKAS